MEVEPSCLDYKSMAYQNSIKRLIQFVNNLEEKLLSVKLVNEKLCDLISVVTKTHDNIYDELTTIKTVLNEIMIEQEEDEIIPIDATKSEWDEDDEDDQEFQARKLNKQNHGHNSPLIRRNDRFVVHSASSNDSLSVVDNRSNSSVSKRSSNLKKSTTSTRTKSPKSVTFSIDESVPSGQQRMPDQLKSLQQVPNNSRNGSFDEITTPIIPCLQTSPLKINQLELVPKIEKVTANIRIHEIEARNGEYLRLLNLSNSDDYDLSGHFLQQSIHDKLICRFRFPHNTYIRAGQIVTIWCGHAKDIIPQPPYVFVWHEQKRWETSPGCLTILAKQNGQTLASFKSSSRMNAEQSSSDILFVHTKSSTILSDTSSNASSLLRDIGRVSNTRQSRYSGYYLVGNNKPPFAHSPNNPIHPDHNGKVNTSLNDQRSPPSQQKLSAGVSQLLNRPKSTPFASHPGCKQDLASRNFLQTQQGHRPKQTTVKT